MAMLGRADEPPYFVGGYGDYFLLPAEQWLYTVPDTVSDEIAAGANCTLAGHVMQTRAGSTSNSARFVVVQNAGALGPVSRWRWPRPGRRTRYRDRRHSGKARTHNGIRRRRGHRHQ